MSSILHLRQIHMLVVSLETCSRLRFTMSTTPVQSSLLQDLLQKVQQHLVESPAISEPRLPSTTHISSLAQLQRLSEQHRQLQESTSPRSMLVEISWSAQRITSLSEMSSTSSTMTAQQLLTLSTHGQTRILPVTTITGQRDQSSQRSKTCLVNIQGGWPMVTLFDYICIKHRSS